MEHVRENLVSHDTVTTSVGNSICVGLNVVSFFLVPRFHRGRWQLQAKDTTRKLTPNPKKVGRTAPDARHLVKRLVLAWVVWHPANCDPKP